MQIGNTKWVSVLVPWELCFGHVLYNICIDFQNQRKSLVPVAGNKDLGSGNSQRGQLTGTEHADFLVNWMQANIGSHTSKYKGQVLMLQQRNLWEKTVESRAAGSLPGTQLRVSPVATPQQGTNSVHWQENNRMRAVRVSQAGWNSRTVCPVWCLSMLLKMHVDKLESSGKCHKNDYTVIGK